MNIHFFSEEAGPALGKETQRAKTGKKGFGIKQGRGR